MSSRFPDRPVRFERSALMIPLLALGMIAFYERSTAAYEPIVRQAPTSSDSMPLVTSSDTVTADGRRILRVCADPNNLPFSNSRSEGFENRIAELIARDLNAELRYTWHAQRRGFIRNTLRAHACDLVTGVPTSVELVLATRPYYRSTYVFVQRADAPVKVSSFDDKVLRKLKVGVQFIGDDYANTPPAHALAARGIVDNVVGFSIYGDYAEPNPPARIVEAVANGTIDVAVVWGPLAGYFAKHASRPLVVRAVSPQIDLPFLPFVFDVSMGVRREDSDLRAEIDRVLERHRSEVEAILDDFGVPRVDVARRRVATAPAASESADAAIGRVARQAEGEGNHD